MAIFNVRQRLLYYEDFEVEAETAEGAIDEVKCGNVDGDGPKYLSCDATYLTDGVFALKDQPENAD
jgi:hypothetical protein